MSDEPVPMPEPSVPLHIDQLLEQRSVAAGVEALARRNQHHLADMDDAEREDARVLWSEMVAEILGAVRDALGGRVDRDGPGRAVIVLSDHPQEPGEVQAEAIFSPQIEEVPGEGGETQVVATFAQVLGMQVADLLPQLAEQMASDVQEGEDGPELPAR
ncbi:hypothetical protein PAI11_12400 [Patulibacter medicamentivorans]|uniref:Uncharacterized protein n=1 Tax=Patulibacter medicamentivorans TaxID=1097667 RepID=H0E372_9ACTN|nr:hypothetical protein [Patulibacter medicamentivorans]EHN11871.1 hypothetical protein PAI11_12400 [Patulibacter medicamentivorans]